MRLHGVVTQYFVIPTAVKTSNLTKPEVYSAQTLRIRVQHSVHLYACGFVWVRKVTCHIK